MSQKDYQIAQQKVVSSLAKMRGYVWKYDRWGLFQKKKKNISIYQ